MHDAKAPLTRASVFAAQQADLAQLSAGARRRGLIGITGADFSSNDYLGLAGSSELAAAVRSALERGVPVGSGGSRLLRGNHPEHEALEAEAAAHFGAEAALYFATGFAANAAIFATLPQRGDLVVHDALIHASAHDGMRLGRAETVSVPHNDANAIDDAIRHWRARGGAGRAWIAVESVYSMEGDMAPIADLATIARRHDAMLVIDEAHATGVLGDGGRGLAAPLEGTGNVITLHTCGKALGASGALVCASRTVRDFLVNRARPFVFSTAPSPLMAATVRASLQLLSAQPERRHALARLVTAGNAAFAAACGLSRTTGTHILPVIVGDDLRAVDIARRLQGEGFDVRAIRPPTVPEGTSRLRVILTLNVDEATVQALAHATAKALR
jgi:8-amino-7-oxononanoate synthase